MSHESIASTFDRWVESGQAETLEAGHRDVVQQVIAAMGIRPGEQILDMGCGAGWATRLLGNAAPGSGAVGIDASRKMIALAEATHDLTSRARYETGTFEALEFPEGRFDRVFSMEAMYYAVDLDMALKEALRVLKEGGKADIIVNCFAESPHTERWSDTVGLSMHYHTEAEWKAAFEEAGFTNVTTTRVLDSRGPGEEADFVPDAHCPDWKTAVELHAAGSLWIHGEKPS